MISVLKVKDGNHVVPWYFEHSADEAPHEFIRAKDLALRAGIYVGEEPNDVISDADEFETWLLENNLLPGREDELTRLIRRGIELEAMYEEARALAAAYTKSADEMRPKVNRFRSIDTGALDGKVKVVDGVAYTRGPNGAIKKLEQA